ncbi:hypothetical protein [Paraburkholderia sp.]|uniref:hypothetical protein n=1 Tax=Paraburkholderia sp. TaxID=1926495 RepID=UPI0039E5EBF9
MKIEPIAGDPLIDAQRTQSPPCKEFACMSGLQRVIDSLDFPFNEVLDATRCGGTDHAFGGSTQDRQGRNGELRVDANAHKKNLPPGGSGRLKDRGGELLERSAPRKAKAKCTHSGTGRSRERRIGARY